jgi:hypothetical protein
VRALTLAEHQGSVPKENWHSVSISVISSDGLIIGIGPKFSLSE